MRRGGASFFAPPDAGADGAGFLTPLVPVAVRLTAFAVPVLVFVFFGRAGGGSSENSDGSRMWSHFGQTAASSATGVPQLGHCILKLIVGAVDCGVNAKYQRVMLRFGVLALLLSGCAHRFDAVDELEDRRMAAPLEVFTRPPYEVDLRVRALLALGRVQDPRSAQYLAVAMTDVEPRVREEAAFATGLLGLSWVPLVDEIKSGLSSVLLGAEKAENDPTVHAAQVVALGRLGSPEALQRLIELLGSASAGRAALALGVAAKHGTKLPDGAAAAAAPLVAAQKPEDVRYGAGYLLAQAKQPAGHDALNACLNDALPEIRALCAKGLGEVGADADVPALKTHLHDDDVRVAVEVARALVKRGAFDAYDTRPAVVLAYAQAGIVPPGLREEVHDPYARAVAWPPRSIASTASSKSRSSAICRPRSGCAWASRRSARRRRFDRPSSSRTTSTTKTRGCVRPRSPCSAKQSRWTRSRMCRRCSTRETPSSCRWCS